jgi:hypothetical protein
VGDQHAAAAEDAGLLEAEVENSSQPLAKASIEASALRQLRELRSATACSIPLWLRAAGVHPARRSRLAGEDAG